MKKTTLSSVLAVCITVATAQINLNDISKQINNAVSNNSAGTLSNDDVVNGLREALTIGSRNAASGASKADGFYKNAAIKIPFPPKAKDMEKTLRGMGMNKPVDDFIMSMNRAAEDAAKSAAPIFVNAVKNMSITDGINILKGKDDAATTYLKNTTSAELTGKFKPIIQGSIQKVEVTKYWKPLAKKYNQLPFVQKVNPNLEDYITQKALDGLFHLIAEEELKIRKDPLARITDILKKVFGWK